MPRAMTAVFPTVAGATALYETFKAKPDNWWIEPGSLRLDGNTVTWRADARADEEPAIYIMDTRQTVGYYGSSYEKRATLNGHPCNPSY